MPESIPLRSVFRSRSGREWSVMRGPDPYGHYRLYPLGSDTHGSGGGVKGRSVEGRRLEQETHGWKRIS